jgi:hypothetical protein
VVIGRPVGCTPRERSCSGFSLVPV